MEILHIHRNADVILTIKIKKSSQYSNISYMLSDKRFSFCNVAVIPKKIWRYDVFPFLHYHFLLKHHSTKSRKTNFSY